MVSINLDFFDAAMTARVHLQSPLTAHTMTEDVLIIAARMHQ